MDWETVSRLLEATHGNPRHGNPYKPVDCLFYLMLSRKTPIATAARIFGRLKELAPDWNDLLTHTPAELATAIRGSGLEEIRAAHIRQVVDHLSGRFGSVTLDPLRTWSDAECLKFLASLPGVGAKTAYCLMMYAMDRQVFPADAHCIRVLQRVGVIPAHLAHRPAQRQLAGLVPPHLAYKLHVNLVAHGQQVCRAVRPACTACAIREHCAYPSYRAEQAAERPDAYNTRLTRE